MADKENLLILGYTPSRCQLADCLSQISQSFYLLIERECRKNLSKRLQLLNGKIITKPL